MIPGDALGADPSFEGHDRMLRLYTDGSYSDETGVGSWAWLLFGNDRSEVGSGAVPGGTTHQRMELTAAVEGLRSVPEGTEVELLSDSAYLVDAMELGYLEHWRTNGWVSISHNRPIVHRDLWVALAELTTTRQVTFTWVKAHNGDGSDPWNVMADHVAKTARRLLEAAA